VGRNYVLEVFSGRPTSIRELIVNYLRAVERFRAQVGIAREPGEQLRSESLAGAALSEALAWADSIDSYLAAGPKDTLGTDRNPQWAQQLTSDEADLVAAFQRIRNLVHHRWLDALATRLTPEDGVHTREWIWAPLPRSKAQGKGKDKERDATYMARLEGRPLLATLDELAGAFWRKRRWAIIRDDVRQPGHDVLSPLKFDDE
jgi:hypothetical protein